MNTEILEDLGLTRSEIKVFLTSLEIGSSAAGPLVEKSGIQNAVVHRCLHSLIEKGLITYILEGKKKIYRAVNPKVLLDFLDEKKDKLKDLIPELIAKQNIAKAQPNATLFRGTRGVKELITSMIDTDAKEYAAYGGAQVSQETLGKHFWIAFHKKRRGKGIKGRIIFHKSLAYWGKVLNKKKNTEIRVTASDHFEELTETFVCGKRVAIVIFSEMPYGLLIEDEAIVKSYMKFFEPIWKDAIPVDKA